MTQPDDEPNAAQAKFWNSRGGQVWVAQQARLDRLFRAFEPVLVDAVSASGARQVLDVGCGAGATTLAVARSLDGQGRCLGLDLSEPLIDAARRRAEAEGAANCRFIAADAQQHAFEPDRFDAMISRFGVMFFDNPVAAFANLRHGARGGASLSFIAWRGAEENPFMTAAEQAAAPWLPELPARDPNGPGQFAFADKDRVAEILATAGWRDVQIQPLDVICAFSEDDLDVYAATMGPVGHVLSSLEEPRRGKVAAVVRRAFEPYVSDGEARFDAACWMISARNPS